MTFPTTISRPIPVRRRWPLVLGTVALMAGLAVALVAAYGGIGDEQSGVSSSSTEQSYVQQIASASPAELRAAFGTGLPTSSSVETPFVPAIPGMSLNPTHLRAVIGSGAVPSSRIPNEQPRP
jgi:hypothetical protein